MRGDDTRGLPGAPFGGEGEAIRRVVAHLHSHSGLVLAPPQKTDLERACREAAVRFACSGELDLAALLDDPARREEPLQWLIREVTIGESYFFRVPEQFHLLRGTVVPELGRRRYAEGRGTLRAWSAACAGGEEAYSLAVALVESLPPDAPLEVSVLGTDINRAFLQRAERAEYSPWSLRGVGDAERARWFVPAGPERWRVRDDVRRRVRFDYLNLKDSNYPDLTSGTPGLDVIFCRNVFIYFEPALAAALAARLGSCLADGGYLFFGPSDPVPLALPGLELVRAATAGTKPGSEASMVFRRVESRRAAWSPAARPATPPPAPATRVPQGPPQAPPDRGQNDLPTCRDRARALADRGRLEEAGAWARRWLALDPGSAEASYLLAMVEHNLGHARASLDLLRRALYLDADFALAHFQMGELHAADGRAAEAQACWEAALQRVAATPESEVLRGSDEISAGWLRRVLRARLRTGSR